MDDDLFSDEDDGFNIEHYVEDTNQEDKVEDRGHKFFNDEEAPNINNATVKFNLGEEESKQISELKGEIKKASIDIEAQIAHTNELKKYYGLLSELWANLKLICGKGFIEHINKQRKESWTLILEAEDKNKIEPKVYYSLLKLRHDLYKIAQAKNLGFAVERISNGNSGAKGKILS